jgi:hypothetical protein
MAKRIRKVVIMACGAEVLASTKVSATRKRARNLGARYLTTQGSVETWSMTCERR